tara:strand:- start:441 stop:650 length:210 start_codon:yes stop_codon:yes gene_type:complete
MDWLGATFSLGLALIIFIPVGALIMFFWNSLFWFVGGLLQIKNPFWRIRGGGIVVLIIYTILLEQVGLI